jgi:ubiquinone/menaquinone biosynthesis C-methylase UbiE
LERDCRFLEKQERPYIGHWLGSGRNFLSGKSYVGLDFSKNMLKYAKEDSQKRKIKALLVRANATMLPIKNDLFETVLYVAVLHVIKGKNNRKKSLLELKRVMKKGGYAIITVWNRDQPRFVKIKPKKESYVPWKYKGKGLQRDMVE